MGRLPRGRPDNKGVHERGNFRSFEGQRPPQITWSVLLEQIKHPRRKYKCYCQGEISLLNFYIKKAEKLLRITCYYFGKISMLKHLLGDDHRSKVVGRVCARLLPLLRPNQAQQVQADSGMRIFYEIIHCVLSYSVSDTE